MPKMTTRYTNQKLAEKFRLIGDLLEIKGEVIYKILAYRKAADSLTSLGRDVTDVWQMGELTDIPGVGVAIAEKIDELLTTGELGRTLLQNIPEIEDLCNVVYLPVLLSSVELHYIEGKADVLVHRHVRIEGVALKCHGHVSLHRRQLVDAFPVEKYLSTCDLLETRNHAQSRGFTASGRSEQRNEFSIPDLHVQINDGVNLLLQRFVNLVDVLECYQCHNLTLYRAIFFLVSISKK